MATPRKKVTRITIDHQPFLDLVKRIKRTQRAGLAVVLSKDELRTLLEHGKWFEQFSQQRRKASASRSSHGPQRKPDSEVSAHALYMRQRRDAKKDRS